MKELDRDIILAIKQGTERAAMQKDEVWNGMQKELEAAKMRENRVKRRGAIWKSVAAVILVGAVFLAATPSGRAAVGSILDLFEPEKNIDWEMEGQPENNDHQLHTSNVIPAPDEQGNAVSYVIYVDEARYYVETADGVDRIVPLDYPEDYPPAYMEISADGRTPEDVAAELEPQVRAEYTDLVMGPQNVTDPIDGIEIRGYAGSEWNSAVVRYYLIDNTLGGTFVVQMQYFLEAEEGHGERFDTMLREFQIVPLQGMEDSNTEPSTGHESPDPDGDGNAAGQESPAPDVGGNAVSYVFDVDESQYRVETTGEVGKIVPLNLPENYPPVFMAISQDTGRTPAQVAEAIEVQLKESYAYVVEAQDVAYPLDAIHLRARTGDEWDSEVVSYYLIDNTLGGTFIVEAQYFLEAEEGHGARFSTMLEQFEVVPLGEE